MHECHCCALQPQVLRRAFPGTLLVPDICGLQCLPRVRLYEHIAHNIYLASNLTSTCWRCGPSSRRQLLIAPTSLLTTPLQDTDMVAAGFPCIDVSRAGLRQGLDGPVSRCAGSY